MSTEIETDGFIRVEDMVRANRGTASDFYRILSNALCQSCMIQGTFINELSPEQFGSPDGITRECKDLLALAKRWKAELLAMDDDPKYTPDVNDPQTVLDIVNVLTGLMSQTEFLKREVQILRTGGIVSVIESLLPKPGDADPDPMSETKH